MSNSTGFYPRIQVDTTNSGAVGQAGGVLLTETITTVGLGPAMSAALSGWRKPLAVHDPAKVVLDSVGRSSFSKCRRLLKPEGIYISSELGPQAQNPFLAVGPDCRGLQVCRDGAEDRQCRHQPPTERPPLTGHRTRSLPRSGGVDVTSRPAMTRVG